MGHNDDKKYKPIDSAFARGIRSDLEENMEKFRDPIIIGEMLYQLLEERENTNRLLKNILQKLEVIESTAGKTVHRQPQTQILPQIDEEILSFVKKKNKVSSEDVRVKFKYRGKNAASARLNRLCKMNLLQKKQVGKKVFFFPL